MEKVPKKNGYIGIDIQRDQIIAVQIDVEPTSKKPRLVTYAVAPRNHRISDGIAKTIKQMLTDGKMTTSASVIGLNNDTTELYLLEFPYHLSERELATAIRERSKELLEGRTEKMATGWSILEHRIEKDEEMRVLKDQSAWDIVFIATPQLELAKLYKIAKKAGIMLIAPEMKAIALTRALAKQLKGDRELVNVESEEHVELLHTRNGMLEELTVFPEEQREDEWTKKRIIAGGGAQAWMEHTGIDGERAHPFKGMLVPEGLEEHLQEVGPLLATATGLALREIAAQ